MSSKVNKIVAATISMNSSEDVSLNLEKASKLVGSAAQNGANWIILPEMFSYMGPYELLQNIAREEHDNTLGRLASLAKEHDVTIFCGTIPEPSTVSNKVHNTMYVVSKEGNVVSKYRKTHLFELNGPTPEMSYRESDGYVAGDKLVAIQIDGFNVHLSICFDIRFPEMFATLQKTLRADIIICPSAFTETTGKRHWHTLMQARAIDFQAYVIAAAQTGTKPSGKSNYGHALIVSPMGDIIDDTKKNEGVAYASLSKTQLTSTRTALPVLNNRRADLYL